MTIKQTIIRPNGQKYIANLGGQQELPGLTQTTPNIYNYTFKGADKPAGVSDNYSRITFAVDVCVIGDWFSKASNHIVVAARLNPNDPVDNNGAGQAWHAAIAGDLWTQPGQGPKFMDEERRQTGNKHRYGGQDPATLGGHPSQTLPVSPHTWYRLVVDSVRVTHDRPYRMYAVRCFQVTDELNNVLGPLLYSSQDFYIPESGFASNINVALGIVANSGHSANVLVGRVAAYYGPANEWTPNP